VVRAAQSQAAPAICAMTPSHILIGGRVGNEYSNREMVAVGQLYQADVVGSHRDSTFGTGASSFIGNPDSMRKKHPNTL
jgi:hypothetical protein